MATSRRNKSKPAVEDIEHVDVPAASATPAFQQPQEAVVVVAEEDPAKTLELTIQREIKRFGIADAGIAELKTKYGDLTIADMNDKAGYEAVKKAWNEVRGVRTALEKKGLDIRGSYTKITKAVKGEEDRLIALVRPLEDGLQEKYRKIDEEREAEKQRRAAEAEKKLQDRVDELVAAGCKFEHGYYGIGGTIAVDVATLREMPDDQFGTLKVAVAAKAAEIKEQEEAAAAEKAEADAARAREDQRLKDEAAKLQKEKDDLERDRQELQKQKDEAAKLKREMRLDRLGALGMTPTVNRTVCYDNGWARYELKLEEIEGATDEEFKALVATAKERVAECQKKLADHEAEVAEEKRVLEAKKERINERLIGAGMSYVYGKDHFTFANGFYQDTFRMDALVGMGDAELDALAAKVTDAIAGAKREQAAYDEANKLAAEKQRRAQLGDRVNFAEYINELLKVAMPEMQSEVYQAKLNSFFTRLDALSKEYLPEEEAVPS